MKAKIHVTLKQGILDPQGKAIEHALATLGYTAVNNVRVGKHIELELDEDIVSNPEAEVKAMCEKLLANTIIEEYAYELESDRLRPMPDSSSEPEIEITGLQDVQSPAAAPLPPQVEVVRSAALPEEAVRSAAPAGGQASWATASARTARDAKAQEEARHLARRILADLALLNPTEVEAGIRGGNFRQALKEDLEEGLKLYRQQVPEAIRNQTDYFGEAVEEFVRERKAALGLK